MNEQNILNKCIFALFEHYPYMYDIQEPWSGAEFKRNVNRVKVYHRSRNNTKSMLILREINNCNFIYELYRELFDEYQVIKNYMLSVSKVYFKRRVAIEKAKRLREYRQRNRDRDSSSALQ